MSKKNATHKCQSVHFAGCVVRKLYLDCPDKIKSDNCASLEDFAKKCHRFPMFMDKHKPNGTKAQANDKKDDKKVPADQKKNDKKTTIPAADKKEQAKNAQGSRPKSQQKSSSEPSTTIHPSKSVHGVKGPNGPGFKE